MAGTRVRLHRASTADDSPALDALLDDAERARADGFVDPDDRARFRVGAALVRLIAGSEARIDRTCGSCGAQHGRPRVVDSRLRVSVSHAGPHVLVASTEDRDLGVDLDRVEPGHEADLTRALGGGDGTDAATRWVRAEAVAKATGRPLRAAPAGHDCVLVDLDAPPGYRAALAVAGTAPVAAVPLGPPPSWPVARGR